MIGSQLGTYKIVDKLGEGGMGIVYKAVDTSLDRVVAIKSLSGELAKNADLEARFRAEAKAQANLNHTNIATLFAFFVQEGTAWMVMEYIEGETFHDMIQRRGPIPAKDAVPLFKQALLGIGYAHRMGIVHRDIKPSNIMVKRDGIVKVMDFGIAKVLGNRGMTRTGTQMGTAYYMSPEQVVNKGVDIRSDVYSLGVTLYEMLTANLPFTGDTDFEVMQAHMQTPPPMPTRFYPYIPKGVENAVLQSIAKRPEQRFQTVEDFGLALEHMDDYVAPAPLIAVAGTPIVGATRMAPLPTQTIQPPPFMPQAPPAPPLYPVPPFQTPPTGMMTAPPPPPVAHVGSSNKKWMLIAGGSALVAMLALGYTLRPKPEPGAPVVSLNQLTPPSSPAQPQGQIPVQIPLPPEEQKPGAKTPPPPEPAPAAGTQQQPNRQTTPPPPPQQQPQQRQQQQTQAPAVNPPTTAPPPAPAPVAESAPPPTAPMSPAAPLGSLSIPAGTQISVRTTGMASTRSSKLGDSISALVEIPVVGRLRVSIPRGVEAILRVTNLDDGISLKLATLVIGGRPYNVSSDTYVLDNSGKKKGVLGRVGGIVRRNRNDDAVVMMPGSRVTFTLQVPLEMAH